MRKNVVFFILILAVVFLSTACKSKPAAQSASSTSTRPASQTETVPTTSIAQPVVTTPAETVTPAPQPTVTTTSTYNRHQSGVILDGATNYTVRRGDTLSGIARQMYQDGSLYPLIMMISGNVDDPDQIMPQQTLVIPNLSLNMNDPTARASINRYFLDIARTEEQRGRRDTAEMIRSHTR